MALAGQPSWTKGAALHAVSYRLVFDAAHQHYALWQILAPWLLAVAFGLVLIRFPNIYGRRPRFYRAFGALLVVVGLGAPLAIWRVSSTQRQHVVHALQEGRFEHVEGRVEHFRPGRADGHPSESFDVAGHHYHYSPSDWLYGFNHVSGAGGPVREGLRVRIADVDGVIARLEIEQ